MNKFAQLLDKLYYTYSNLEKINVLKKYFSEVPDPDRGYAIAIIAGTFRFSIFKRSLVKNLIYEYIDPVLFDLSYDYVGDLSETIAHLWPDLSPKLSHLPALNIMIHDLNNANKTDLRNHLMTLLNTGSVIEKWAILKLGTGSLRIGVSSRFLKQALAEYGHKTIHELEEIWHAVSPPYIELFAWLENKSSKPDIENQLYFHPVMLSTALSDKDLEKITPTEYSAEWKYDGIRVQLVSLGEKKALFSRTGDNISEAFPDVLEEIQSKVVLDGELLIKKQNKIGSYNDLQQRLNRKKPSQKLMRELVGHIIIYDMLSVEGLDIRNLSFEKRRAYLENWFKKSLFSNLALSPLLEFKNSQTLLDLKHSSGTGQNIYTEGLILKRKESAYSAGRPAGQWYKWKRDPYIVDAVLMYAQRGHGKRSSFYSDFTFGLWKDKKLLPIGKAYFGFTDEELKKLDHWIRHHTAEKFGPVREVEKQLVLEIAFEGVALSPRHKSGYALRFPRISRIRWDKPANEADQLQTLANLIL